jgi:phosphoserine phosphatase
MSAVRLVAFDLDGTLVRGDTTCEALARGLGHLDHERELDRLAVDADGLIRMREELAGYYRGRTHAELEACFDHLVLAPGATEAFKLFARRGITIAIVTLSWEFGAEWLARRLGADHVYGTRLEADGRVTHVFPGDKGTWLAALMAQLGLGADDVAVVGDSWRDVEMFAVATHRYYVAPAMFPGLDARHYPDGDLAEIAREILKR